jgi:hypothetical protein
MAAMTKVVSFKVSDEAANLQGLLTAAAKKAGIPVWELLSRMLAQWEQREPPQGESWQKWQEKMDAEVRALRGGMDKKQKYTKKELEKMLNVFSRVRRMSRYLRPFFWIPIAWKWTLVCYRENILCSLCFSGITEFLKKLMVLSIYVMIGLPQIIMYPFLFIAFVPMSFLFNWYDHSTKITEAELDTAIERCKTELAVLQLPTPECEPIKAQVD